MPSQNVNKIILIGNLGHDPELRKTPKGHSVLTLNVATNRDVKKANGEHLSEVHWHRATLWGKMAEVCAANAVRGSRVFLEGELLMKSYTDKDGISRKSAEIWVDQFRFLGGGRRLNPEASESAQEIGEPALTH
ncbi:MAG: single-stranded DNA-binding protein [Proteobacteria bacterium]|nr:MAG: single-stranded DNA-binding protein [Pseudomonadota bacterium]